MQEHTLASIYDTAKIRMPSL